jgi:type VI secretion system protein ImpI
MEPSIDESREDVTEEGDFARRTQAWYVDAVGLGLKLRITNTRDNTSLERTFDRFPVRIGRNPLNDMQLDLPFVSQFHAVLELNGQTLMLRDLGSKNGTLLRGAGRVPPNTVVDLAATNYEFAIVTLIFQAAPLNAVEAAKEPATRKRHGTVLAMSSADATKLVGQGQPSHPSAAGMPAVVPGMPPGVDASAQVMAQVKPLYEAYRAAWAQVYRVVYNGAGQIDPVSKAQLLRRITAELPALSGEIDFQRLAAHFGSPIVAPTAGAASKEEGVALQGLKELAAWYLPGGRPLEGVPDIVAFLQKLQDTMDVFLKCFVPLRDGYKQFEKDMDIKKTARPGGALQQVPGTSVETARDPKELASKLLDYRDPTNEHTRTVESTFADLMIHQVAMLNGVMKGVKSLLTNLAPTTIERELDDPRSKKSSGLLSNRYKSLWELYTERHSDYADEEKEAFGVIFGKEFVGAYSQLAGEHLGPRGTTSVPQHAQTGSHAGHANPSFPSVPSGGSVPPPPYVPPRR